MKVIVDVGVGMRVERTLRELGHDVLAVRDLDPTMEDREILSRAAEEGRLIITMDKDFGELAIRGGARHAGVLLLRLEEASGKEKADIVRKLFSEYRDTISGRFAVYQGGGLRVR